MGTPTPDSAGARLVRTVGESDTAAAVGSGSLPVLGTPVLLAWCEEATCAAIADALGEGETTVGTRVEVEHLAPSAVGAQLVVTARLVHTDGRLRRFAVAVREVGPQGADDGPPGRLVGSGEVTRVVVDAERFLARLHG